ncbi:hypothetical protein RsS62_64310 [Rhizobium dioscoreae]|nr:hypothetical protein RsS62_64310 [Rhizobium dioscoreae]
MAISAERATNAPSLTHGIGKQKASSKLIQNDWDNEETTRYHSSKLDRIRQITQMWIKTLHAV